MNINKIQKIVLGVTVLSLVASIIVQIVFPWPFGLMVALTIFIVAPLISSMIIKKKLGSFGFTNTYIPKMEKRCIACGKTTKKPVCPRCGSNQFKYE